MSDLLANLLKPLDKRSCLYFYVLSAFFLFIFIILILGGIVYLVRKRGQISYIAGLHGVILFFNAFLAYFINRLFYSMCARSLA
jgi:hypothetical protein